MRRGNKKGESSKHPIKRREKRTDESYSGKRKDYTHGLPKLIEGSKQTQTAKNMQNASQSRKGKNYIRASYEAGGHLQKMIELVKSKDSAPTARLPAPRRERFI